MNLTQPAAYSIWSVHFYNLKLDIWNERFVVYFTLDIRCIVEFTNLTCDILNSSGLHEISMGFKSCIL